MLTPTNKDLAVAVKRVEIAMDRKTSQLRFVELLTAQDDVTRYWFYDVRVNETIAADVFKPVGAAAGPVDATGPASGAPPSERGEERWDRSLGARWFADWTRYWVGHRVGLAVVLVVIGGFFSFLSRGVVWQADVLQFFSADSAEVRAVRKAAQEPGIATQLRLDVHGAGVDVKELESRQRNCWARELNESGEFLSAWTGGVGDAELAASYGRLAGQGPVLLGDGRRVGGGEGAGEGGIFAKAVCGGEGAAGGSGWGGAAAAVGE